MLSPNLKMKIFRKFCKTLKICKLGLNTYSRDIDHFQSSRGYSGPLSPDQKSVCQSDLHSTNWRWSWRHHDDPWTTPQMAYQTKGLNKWSNFASGTVRPECFLRGPAEGEGEVTLGPPLNMYSKRKLSLSWATLSLHNKFQIVKQIHKAYREVITNINLM